MSENTYGPSWWDVAAAVEAMQARRGFRAVITLQAPFQNPLTRKWNAWGVCVAKPPLPGAPTTGRACWAYFGKGGAHKSATAAAYAALLELEDVLSVGEDVARGQAAF
jgi:hypothetical protein